MQLRGANIAYKSILFDDLPTPVVSLTKIQGRSQELNKRRNECLLDRYYFLARRNGTGVTYDANVRDVAAQFFLSPYHASKVILGHPKQLTELKLQWKNESLEKMQKYFTKKWPHLMW